MFTVTEQDFNSCEYGSGGGVKHHKHSPHRPELHLPMVEIHQGGLLLSSIEMPRSLAALMVSISASLRLLL
jgi:hypothetical protein